jgi:YHS domain-containing protein
MSEMKNKNYSKMKLLSVGYIVFILISSTSCMTMHNMPMQTNNKTERRINDHSDTVALSDPVCGIQLDMDTAISLVHEGNIYYFDTEECLNVFQKNPEKFITKDTKIRSGNNKQISGEAIIGVTAMAV